MAGWTLGAWIRIQGPQSTQPWCGKTSKGGEQNLGRYGRCEKRRKGGKKSPERYGKKMMGSTQQERQKNIKFKALPGAKKRRKERLWIKGGHGELPTGIRAQKHSMRQGENDQSNGKSSQLMVV